MDIEEIWRPVVGYEGLYEVSSLGRIRNLGHRRAPRIKTASLHRTGYPQVVLYRAQQPRPFKVHRLVAAAFIGPCPIGYEVNHIDGDRRNAAASNLEYVTPAENLAHSERSGRRDKCIKRGAHNGSSRLTSDAVRVIRTLSTTLSQAEIARRFSIHPATVNDILHGRKWAWLT